MPKGKIFSIEEFSVYDGPGIRMTVFLKGCPLRCEWCHNPEGQSFHNEMARSPNGCLSCGACEEMGRKLTGKPCLVPESASVCPQKLVRVCGEDVSAEELSLRIEKNAAILSMNGGGVTFSGGEPLCHAEFLLECLRLLKGKVHRALQTCGYADEDTFSAVLRECDYVLYDLKLIDPELHKKHTGVSNEKILANYRTLARSGKDFVTRIPLIPGVNDTEENLRATAELLSSLGVKYIEILPYNKMAGGKYALLGKEYRVSFDGSVEPQPRKELFASYGIEVKVL